ncbi:MAG TPA: flagellar biosynthesis anti-sigma factor FlgM [Noviherbaspirillum sp.]
MKITDSLNTSPGLGATSFKTRAGKASEKESVENTSTASSDNVTLSAEAQARATHASGGDQVFDSKKVEEIKAAIASGRFQINAGRIADGLIDTVKNLISSRKD